MVRLSDQQGSNAQVAIISQPNYSHAIDTPPADHEAIMLTFGLSVFLQVPNFLETSKIH